MLIARALLEYTLDVLADDVSIGIDITNLVVRSSREGPQLGSNERRDAGHQIIDVFAYAISIFIGPSSMGKQTHFGLRPAPLQRNNGSQSVIVEAL
jgi:hypothetical protein